MKGYILLFAYILVLGLVNSQTSTKTSLQMRDNFHWLDTQNILVLGNLPADSTTMQLLRSTDGGGHWEDITSQLFQAAASPPLPPLYVNPNFPSRIYLNGRSTYSWVSSNKGESWQAVQPGYDFWNFDWHPKNPDWALATNSQYSVYLTKDGGINWTPIEDGVLGFGWGDAGSGDVPESRIYLVTYSVNAQIPWNLVQTDDFGATQQVLQPHAYQFVYLDKQMFAPVYLPTAGKVALKVTPDTGKNVKTFYEASFPFGDSVPYNSYTILDDSTGAVYLGVNHGDIRETRWGNVYVSDSSGAKYATSLLHTALLSGQGYSFYDFDSVKAVEGIYLGNVLRNWDEDTTSDYDEILTYFTYDNGGSWSLLTAPHFDSNGHPIKSGNLHLNGLGGYFLQNFGPFYSAQNAIGLIIATGSVGEYLSKDETQINTYLSRDAGLTWSELRKGSSIYEFGDHGGIIVAAPFGIPTDTVYYSLDEGNTTMNALIFTTTPVLVVNIIVDPDFVGRKFILIAADDSVYGLDFSTVFTRNCDLNLDYDLWSPSNGRIKNGQPGCLLGRNIVYRRRKPTSQCFNDPDMDHTVSVTNCQCTEDDFECDFGFYRATADAPCVLETGATAPTYPPAYCPEGSNYYKTKGYRLEPGNSCEGGVDLRAEGPFPCPSQNFTPSSQGWLAALIVIPIVLLLIVGGFIALRSSKVREKLPFLKVLSTWKVGYFGVKPDTVNIDFEDEDQENGTEFTVGVDQDENPLSINSERPSEQRTPMPDIDDFNPRSN